MRERRRGRKEKIMFLCEKCHPKDCDCLGCLVGLFRSYGRCEHCGVTAACFDCHGSKPPTETNDETGMLKTEEN